MSLSDPIADMLTRIRNARMAKLDAVEMPYSKMKCDIARILKREGYIRDFSTEGGGGKRVLCVYLKYSHEQQSSIEGLKRVSRPGLRRYVGAEEIPRVLGGMGVAILSTSSGVLTDSEARKKQIGGEVICHIW